MNEQTAPSPAPARVVFIRSPKPMSEELLRQALGSMSEDDPRWLAFNQLLDRALAAAVYDSSDPQLDASKGTYSGGRVGALSELKAELHQYRAAPVKKPAPAAAKNTKGGRR